MTTDVKRPAGSVNGRGWAYGGAGLGGAVSVAANVAHSYLPPAGAPAGWRPELGAVLGAVFWPVALFVAVEIFARVSWPAGKRWVALRFLGLLPVALVAAVVSYRHLSGLLTHYREDGLTAVIGPLAVDGLMVMATGALIAAGNTRRAEKQARAASGATASGASVTADEPKLPTVPARRTGTPGERRTGTGNARRAGTRTDSRTDAALLAALADVPREPDGTVPVRRAAAALKCGPDRARRLLRDAGLLRQNEPPDEPAAPAPVAA